MLSNRDKAELGVFPNYILNGGAESGTSGWSGYNDTQTVTITIASPAVFTVGSTTGFYLGMPILFTTTGALPTGLTSGTTYYVSSVVSGTTFRVSATLGGSDVNTSGTQSGTHTARPLVPLDGTGGTLSGLTFSSSTSSPLIGNEMLQLVQSNSTIVAGQGISYSFTIDPAFQAQVLSIRMNFNASSTFVASSGQTGSDSDLKIFIYDVTNAVLIPVTPSVLLANGSNNFLFKGIFQTASNSTSYRLCIHTSTSNANATGWTFKCDGFYLGPQPILQGPPATDWIQYNMTITGSVSNPTKGTVSADQAFWRRVGDSMIIRYEYNQTSAGSAGSGIYGFSLPAGFTIDSSKISVPASAGESSVVGPANVFSTTNGENVGWVGVNSSTTLFVEDSSGNKMGSARNSLSNTSVRLGFTAEVPITGWSSTTLMSNDASTRVVAAKYRNTTNFAASTTTPVNYDTLVYDTHGAVTVSPTAWKFIAPVSGWYKISGAWCNSSNTPNIHLYKNGSFVEYLSTSAIATDVVSLSSTIQLISGDFIDIRPSTSSTTTGATAGTNYINVEQVQGPSNIAVVDSANARYIGSNTAISGSLTTIVWKTKDFDNYNAMSSGIYTIPFSGKWAVGAQVLVNGTYIAGNSSQIAIFKNGVADSYSLFTNQGSTSVLSLPINGMVNCNAGDLISVQVSSAATSPSINTFDPGTFFYISYQGK